MQQFISNIYNFLLDILGELYTAIDASNTTNVVLGLNRPGFLSFLDKQLLNGDLLSINMTFKEFFMYFGTLFIAVLFIVIFIRFIWSMLTLIKDSTTKWR